MPSAEHASNLVKDIRVDTTKGYRCHHMAVVIGPSSKHRIELLDQGRHRGGDVFANQFLYLLHEGMNSRIRRRDVQFSAKLANGLPEERESVFDVRDQRFSTESSRPRTARNFSTTG